MKKIFNKTIKTVLPIVLGILILYMIYADFDFTQLWAALSEMDLTWFAVSTFFGIMSHVIRGWRWRLTLAPLGYAPSSAVCVDSIFIAYAANLVVPRVGEVSRCVVLEQYERVPFAQSLGTVVSERLIDTLMVVSLTVLAVLLQWPVFCRFLGDAGFATAESPLFASIGGWVVVLLSLAGIMALLYRVIRKMAFWKRIKSFISNFVVGITSLARMKNGWLFILETVGIWFCYFMQFYLCFFCFGFSSGLSVAAALLLFVGGSIAVVVPTPNGAGPWHYVIINIMLLYGVSTTDAQVFALIVHSTQTLLVALLGLYGIAALQLRSAVQRKRND